jgi:lipopolysaccharide transport system permease protein
VQAATTITAENARAAPPVRRIRPSRGLVAVDFRELWDYRALLYLFMWRDVKTRYRQTFLSGFWAIFRPLTSMVLFSVVFGGIAGIESGTDVPYPLFVFPGVMLWAYFTSAVIGSTLSLGANGGLLSKAYFPRLYAPISTVTVPLTDLVLSLIVLFGLFAWYGRLPSWHIVFFPVVVLVGLLIALGIGLWVTGLAVRYRDVGFAIPFLVQTWLYATPVIYPVSAVPERYQWLLALNPLSAVVEGSKWAVLGYPFPSAALTASSLGAAFVLVGAGVYIFRRSERTVVDLM